MSKQKSSVVRIYNCSSQMIALQVRPPNSDFYRNEQQVRINPGQDALLPKSHLRNEQIENLQKRRMIQVIYDSEAHVDQEAAVTP
jgi:hypothetical protein